MSVASAGGKGDTGTGQRCPGQHAGAELHELNSPIDDPGGGCDVERLLVGTLEAPGGAPRELARARVEVGCRGAGDGECEDAGGAERGG